MSPVIAMVLSYLAGSVPFAYLAGRLLKGIDLRTVGSGNLGATNVYRTLGAWPAVAVLLLDATKGALPALLLPRLVLTTPEYPDQYLALGVMYGTLAIIGHAKPIFLWGKGGGKGVATAAGVFAAIAPIPLAIVLVVFAAVVAITRFVSLGSMLAAIALPFAIAWRDGVRVVTFEVALLIAIFVCWTHRANIGRLRRGEEPRIGRPGATA
ncbi:MAG: glycerol-3-phosphate 1-O-acyltransferase PlsY [Gemmatimonadaceae bacterium]|nr:glycerol-3-phosphate 1-O-acyltransferase PlsY [Gemmatimonadaceae bacterium]